MRVTLGESNTGRFLRNPPSSERGRGRRQCKTDRWLCCLLGPRLYSTAAHPTAQLAHGDFILPCDSCPRRSAVSTLKKIIQIISGFLSSSAGRVESVDDGSSGRGAPGPDRHGAASRRGHLLARGCDWLIVDGIIVVPELESATASFLFVAPDKN